MATITTLPLTQNEEAPPIELRVLLEHYQIDGGAEDINLWITLLYRMHERITQLEKSLDAKVQGITASTDNGQKTNPSSDYPNSPQMVDLPVELY